ncbi:MAG: ferredoxin family protein [Bryobacterales bacterium]|nr:ferredoxin family protein [Bryobacterales bacterium]
MSKLTTPRVRTVLYEGPGSEPLAGDVRQQAVAALLDRGFAVTSLREASPIAAGEHDVLLILGRFAGPAPRLQAQAPIRFEEITGLDAPAIAAAAERVQAEAGAVRAGDWKPWFPVIDYARCTNCMQCLSFCLFDVYGVSSAGKIEVRNQDNCKTECPACSRVCPEVAIMFPKYRHSPINGDRVSQDDIRREAMKVDISALLGGDVYGLLRDRTAKAQSRFSKERDDERALKERQNCLAKLQKEMDIPMEVIASLPSPDEIRRKAGEAAERAREALQQQRPESQPAGGVQGAS